MEYRQLRRSGLKVSAIGIGTEHLKDEKAEKIGQILHASVRAGINYFDLV